MAGDTRLARRAGPMTASCPTDHMTSIAIGTTYQDSGRSEKLSHQHEVQRHGQDRARRNAEPAHEEVLHLEVAHDLHLRGAERAPDADLPRAPADVEARQTDDAEAGDDEEQSHDEGQHPDHRRIAEIGQGTHIVHRAHVLDDPVLVALRRASPRPAASGYRACRARRARRSAGPRSRFAGARASRVRRPLQPFHGACSRLQRRRRSVIGSDLVDVHRLAHAGPGFLGE